MKRNKYVKTDTGKILLWILGGLASFVPVFGETPMVLSYFASVFMAGSGRGIISALLLLVFMVRGISLEILRYITAAVSFGFIWKIVEARGAGKRKWTGSIYVGAIFVFIGISGDMLSVESDLSRWFVVFEGLFVAGVSMLLNRIGEWKADIPKETEIMPESLFYPERERMLETARALKKLARTFFGLQELKKSLNQTDMEQIYRCLTQQVCGDCTRYKECWMMHSYGAFQATEALFRDEESAATVSFLENCLRPEDYRSAARDLYDRAKISLLWENRLQESREAVGGQLQEMSGVILDMAEEIYGKEPLEEAQMEKIRSGLRGMRIEVTEGKGYLNCHGNPELLLHLKAKSGYSLSMREIEKKVSSLMGERMSIIRDGRRVINGRTTFLHLKKEAAYKYLYGVAKSTKDREMISGDNFTITLRENEKLLLGLSDGMGSGVQASKDSETVMDFMEQFFEAGFRKETAVNLLNTTWLARGLEPGGATLDLCSIDLYEGTYEILKQGAAASFIVENGKVRTIRGKSLPIGVCAKGGFELFQGSFGKEAYLVMLSDGVTDAFWKEDGEKVLEELLLCEKQKNPKLLANSILEEAMAAGNGRARDDMTVLVLGLWKKSI